MSERQEIESRIKELQNKCECLDREYAMALTHIRPGDKVRYRSYYGNKEYLGVILDLKINMGNGPVMFKVQKLKKDGEPTNIHQMVEVCRIMKIQ